MKFSVIIPACNEERFIGSCLRSIRTAGEAYPGDVQIVVVLNRCVDRTEAIAREFGAVTVADTNKNLSKIRNAGAKLACGEILLTIDADSTMSPNMLAEIDRLLGSGKYIGGGVLILPERISLGISVTALAFLPYLLLHRISAGLFWCYRKDFEAVGGFDEDLVSAEDIDFAMRLRKHGRTQGKRFKMIWRAHIRTSCRKFDTFGDWYFLRNPGLLWTLVRGKDEKAANHFFYDFGNRSDVDSNR